MEALAEVDRCQDDLVHFADTHGQILVGEGESAAWAPFRLWPAQREIARTLQDHRLVVLLKSRQIGLTWLCLALALWDLLLRPVATVLLFSRRDREASDLLSRLRGMHARLPPWMRAGDADPSNGHEWRLPSGSRALAFPTTAGDSYTGSLVLVDEADLVPDLDRLVRAVKPAIDAGGRMVLLSRADKSQPESPFKRVYRAARAGTNDWCARFAPWTADPRRTPVWYEAQRRDVLARTGSLDDLHEQYPATEAEALSPRTLDKRLPAAWLEACHTARDPLPLPPGAPALPGLEVHALPVPGRRYVLGVDPAEGNPGSDDSAIEVLDVATGDECAALAGKIEPAVLAASIARISEWYHWAPALVERQNHGHAVLAWLRQNAPRVRRLAGPDGREGWLTSTLTKPQLFDRLAEAVRNGEVTTHSLATFAQLASVDGNTLRAPPGQHDDRAVAFALANAARPRAHPPVPGPQPARAGRTVADELRARGATR